MAYERNAQTIPDDSPGGSTVRQGVKDQNSLAIDNLFTYLNSHANNENGLTHEELDTAINYITENVLPAAETAQAQAEMAEIQAKVYSDEASDCAEFTQEGIATHEGLVVANEPHGVKDTAGLQCSTETLLASILLQNISNANGNAIKLADGNLFCYTKQFASGLWTFPEAFNGAPYCFGTCMEVVASGKAKTVVCRAPSASSVETMVVDHDGNYDTGTALFVFAIGKWGV